MIYRMQILFVCCVLVASVSMAGIAAEKDFHFEVQTVYGFSPHTLTSEQINQKSVVLDRFWEKVKSNPVIYLPLLRTELNRADNPTFLYYDGSKLLLSLSPSREDRQLSLMAISRADLSDIQQTDYLLTIHKFAVDGFDTTKAALRILDEPTFQAFIPQHSLTLGQNYCLAYVLLPINEDYYLEKIIDRLGSEKSEVGQKSMLLMLSYTVTAAGDKAISEFAVNASKPIGSRQYAGELIKNSKPGLMGYLSISSYSELKKERQKTMARVSDEALYELDSLTAKIRAKKPY